MSRIDKNRSKPLQKAFTIKSKVNRNKKTNKIIPENNNKDLETLMISPEKEYSSNTNENSTILDNSTTNQTAYG